MIDVLDAVRDYLLTVSAVTNLTGSGRIYAGVNVPPPGYQPADGQALCINVRGGRPDYSNAVLFPSLQFKSYGASPLDARELSRAVYTALHHQAGSKDARWFEGSTIGQNLKEPDTGWDYVLDFYDVTITTEEV